MDIKFSDFEDNDRKRQLSEMTKTDYWEVQADMWHQNYKEATDEIERLREALKVREETEQKKTLWDEFAMAALPTVLQNGRDFSYATCAMDAYAAANEMLKARMK